MIKNTDTIVAISTAPLMAAIGIVRLSGINAIEITEKFFSKSLNDIPTHTLVHGFIIDEKQTIDEVVVSVFRSPNSYTGEDVVEISCHGSLYILNSVIKTAIKNGARQACEGEFTKRAFINGKLDLSQAEAVIDLIESETEEAATVALSSVKGHISLQINEMRDELLNISSQILACIDFPDDDIEDLKPERLELVIKSICNKITELRKSYSQGQIIKNGIKTVICGRPNSGKSMLMNKLLGYDRSIVTNIAGTTRDVIEETAVLGGLKFILSDTAGIHESKDTVEKIGVSRALEKLLNSDVLLCVFDNSLPLTKEDELIKKQIENNKALKIAVLNKCDIEKKLNLNSFMKFDACVELSAKTGEGINQLVACMTKITEKIKSFHSNEVITNARQYECLVRGEKSLINAIENINITPDAILIDIEESISSLGEITGKTVSSEITENIFSRFCVGK